MVGRLTGRLRGVGGAAPAAVMCHALSVKPGPLGVAVYRALRDCRLKMTVRAPLEVKLSVERASSRLSQGTRRSLRIYGLYPLHVITCGILVLLPRTGEKALQNALLMGSDQDPRD
eukprot:4941690-Prymnesium_polylepis.1